MYFEKYVALVRLLVRVACGWPVPCALRLLRDPEHDGLIELEPECTREQAADTAVLHSSIQFYEGM